MAVLAAIALLLSILMGARQKLLSSLALASVLILAIAIALLGTDPISVKPSILFLVPAFTCLGAMFFREGLVLRTQAPTSVALALTFLVLPHLFALGSNTNYWLEGSKGVLFWMLAVVAFLSPLAQEGRSVASYSPLRYWHSCSLHQSSMVLSSSRSVRRRICALIPLSCPCRVAESWCSRNPSTTIWPRPEPRLVRPALKLVPRWSISLASRRAYSMCSKRERSVYHG